MCSRGELDEPKCNGIDRKQLQVWFSHELRALSLNSRSADNKRWKNFFSSNRGFASTISPGSGRAHCAHARERCTQKSVMSHGIFPVCRPGREFRQRCRAF